MDSTQPKSNSSFKQLVWLTCIVLILRGFTGLIAWQSLQEDPDAYAQLAIGLADHGSFGFASSNEAVVPTAFRPPLYPWLLSWLVSDSKLQPIGLFLLHLVLSVVVATLAFSIAGKLKLRWPLLAGLFVTIDPLLIRAGQQVMTELLATMLALMAWWLWLIIWPKTGFVEDSCRTTKRSFPQWFALYGIGLVLGLSILARPTAAPWAVLCIAFIICCGCRCWKRRVVDMMVVTTGTLLCILPWTLRNMEELGRPIWATTHGGYTLLLANNPSLYQHFINNGPNRSWDAESFHAAWANRGIVQRETLKGSTNWLKPELKADSKSGENGNSAQDAQPDKPNRAREQLVHSLGELADDSLAYELAIQTIKSDPKTFILSCLYRLSWLWAWWPNGAGKLASLAIGSWYGTILVLAIIGLYQLLGRGDSQASLNWLSRRITAVGPWLPGLALIIVLSIVHCVYWSNMRMRAPAMPCVYLLALSSLAKRKS